ncbi:MAG: response regulator [Spirochaetaceae bacterium]|nr:response regulator [Spirochaetaceae bacterium]
MIREKPRVLYVDDNRLDRELIRDALTHAERDYELIEASSAQEFEAALNETRFDVVLTDFDICGFKGLQVLARVHERYPKLPVIIVTGTGSEEIAVAAMKSGAADYIFKSPKSISRLPASIEAILHFHHLAEEKALAEISLRESEARFRRAVIAAPVPVMIHAEDGEIMTISDIWLQLTGYDRSELTSTRTWAEHAYGRSTPDTQETISQTYEGTDPRDEGEFTITCADGSMRIWAFRSTPLGQLPDGRRCAISIASDMTEHRRLEAQLRQSQKLEAVGRLAGGVAHDFNNMLQVILGYAALAIDEIGPSLEVPGWLLMIMEAAKRSANLTRQLLAFARIQPLEPKPVKVEEALPGIVKLLTRIVEEQVTLTCEVAPETWDVEVDPAQLDSIVANLVINARDAIAGSGRIDVRAMNRSIQSADHIDLLPGDYVAITVRDTGTGIDPDALDRVFEPFFSTKERGIGSGLGLATVFGIVRQNHGWVSVESELRKGSIFTVLLRRYNPSPGMKQEKSPRVQSEEARRVLLVEDDEAVLRITERLLTDLGHRVTATGDPIYALELVRQGIGPVDLIVSDVVMPGLNGPELVEELRKVMPEVPVLYTSGYPAGTVSDHGVLDDDIHYLPKPFSREELAQKISETFLSAPAAGPTSNGED